jgi:pentatricopeptide repeat protein
VLPRVWGLGLAADEGPARDDVGRQPNVITYSSPISAYDKGGQWQKAEAAFKQMQAAGLTPNVITYSKLGVSP